LEFRVARYNFCLANLSQGGGVTVGIRKAAQKQIECLGLNDIGLEAQAVGEAGSKTRIERLYIPPITKRAEIIEGTTEEVSMKLAELFKGKGVL